MSGADGGNPDECICYCYGKKLNLNCSNRWMKPALHIHLLLLPDFDVTQGLRSCEVCTSVSMEVYMVCAVRTTHDSSCIQPSCVDTAIARLSITGNTLALPVPQPPKRWKNYYYNWARPFFGPAKARTYAHAHTRRCRSPVPPEGWSQLATASSR